MSRAIAWFVHNPVAANLLMLVMVMGGSVALFGIRQQEFPAIEPDAAQITVEYRGASPEEVEQSICLRIEEAIEGTPNLDRIQTIAAEGACNVTAELVIDSDVDAAVTEIENRIDSIDTFPVEAEKPSVSKLQMRRGVLNVAISGKLDEFDLKRLGQRARNEIAELAEVSQVQLKYDRPYELSIEVSEATLRRHGLDLATVARAVRNASLDLPGGSVKTQGGEILLRAKGQAYRGVEFEEIVVLTRTDGTLVRLGEIGRVIDGFEDTELRGRFNGDPSVVVKVELSGEEDILEAAAAVKAWVPQFRASVPEGVEVTIFHDESMDLVTRLDVLLKNGRSGLMLVLIVLAFFLRFRLAMWVSAGVPIAFLGAVMLFPAFDLLISTLTVMACILVLGVLVDDAIVIGESVHAHEVELGDQLQAAIKGTQAVYVPVIFGVMTSMAAFLPMIFLPGRMGSFFGVIGQTAILCLAFSLIESQLILPAHLAHRRLRPKRGAPNTFVARWTAFQSRMSDWLSRLGNVQYGKLLDGALEWRYAVLTTAIGVLVLTASLFASGRMRYQFFPQVAGNIAYATLTMARGVPLERTELAVAQIQHAADRLRRELAEEYPGPSLVRHTFASVGEQLVRGGPDSGRASGGTHLAEVGMELIPDVEREITTDEVLARWRELTGPVPDAIELVFGSDAFSAGEAINIELFGSEDLDDLTQASALVKQFLATFAGVSDISDSFRAGKQEIQLSVRESALPLGLTQNDLARQVRQAFYGEEAQRIQRGRDDVRVMVRYPEAERRSLGSLEEMRIRTRDGIEVPFAAVAEAKLTRGFASIRRTDRQRVVTVTAGVNRRATTPERVLAAFQAWTPELEAAFPGVSFRLGGEQREQADAAGGIAKGFGMAMMVIYVLLAIPLRSYLQPFIIMSVIPFGTVGAILGHLLLGWDVVFFSVLGMVALSGVVVNSSLVLVHSINAQREKGLPLLEALRTAATLRFRPIVLTTATTFFGLLPLMFEKAVPAVPIVPMAISLGFGVLYASVMTLFLVPVGYVILSDLTHGRH
ncbi:MAG: efflux RND transporter permease subunit [Deltaproteobacteria bacterium]|nr:efflux RND transporter permease subunit [Deltaproteobacteria bacterium]